MTATAAAIFAASAKGFQRSATLRRTYGIMGAANALAEIEAAHPGKRMRVYGIGGGIGPGAK